MIGKTKPNQTTLSSQFLLYFAFNPREIGLRVTKISKVPRCCLQYKERLGGHGQACCLSAPLLSNPSSICYKLYQNFLVIITEMKHQRHLQLWSSTETTPSNPSTRYHLGFARTCQDFRPFQWNLQAFAWRPTCCSAPPESPQLFQRFIQQLKCLPEVLRDSLHWHCVIVSTLRNCWLANSMH